MREMDVRRRVREKKREDRTRHWKWRRRNRTALRRMKRPYRSPGGDELCGRRDLRVHPRRVIQLHIRQVDREMGKWVKGTSRSRVIIRSPEINNNIIRARTQGSNRQHPRRVPPSSTPHPTIIPPSSVPPNSARNPGAKGTRSPKYSHRIA